MDTTPEKNISDLVTVSRKQEDIQTHFCARMTNPVTGDTLCVTAPKRPDLSTYPAGFIVPDNEIFDAYQVKVQELREKGYKQIGELSDHDFLFCILNKLNIAEDFQHNSKFREAIDTLEKTGFIQPQAEFAEGEVKLYPDRVAVDVKHYYLGGIAHFIFDMRGRLESPLGQPVPVTVQEARIKAMNEFWANHPDGRVSKAVLVGPRGRHTGFNIVLDRPEGTIAFLFDMGGKIVGGMKDSAIPAIVKANLLRIMMPHYDGLYDEQKLREMIGYWPEGSIISAKVIPTLKGARAEVFQSVMGGEERVRYLFYMNGNPDNRDCNQPFYPQVVRDAAAQAIKEYDAQN